MWLVTLQEQQPPSFQNVICISTCRAYRLAAFFFSDLLWTVIYKTSHHPPSSCNLSQILDSVVDTCSYWDLRTIRLMAPRLEFIYLAKPLMMQGLTIISKRRKSKGFTEADIRVTPQKESKSENGNQLFISSRFLYFRKVLLFVCFAFISCPPPKYSQIMSNNS